ncbi:MAG TPA: lysophospholipid acyltransferase family protein [Stellaceae bacterium]|nr:lysophospholipid acyltransferase family protein [Stellaceae bacterium]
MGSPTLRWARLATYLLWTAALMPVQAFSLVLNAPWVHGLPRFYHRCCCRILGFRVTQIGEPMRARPALYVSNHVSYTDITVVGSLIQGSFIAKAEVAGWPLFGWLAKLQRSVFIDRQVRSLAAQRAEISRRLAAADALILFPEGTSGDGNRLLPFKSALFAVLEGGPTDVGVQPVSVAYTRLDGLPMGRALRPFFAWYGDMTMPPHLWRLLGLGIVEVVIEFHPPTTIAACGTRKELTRYCYDRIAEGLSAALSGRRPLPARAELGAGAADAAPVAAG